jgi:hypothetical protein
MHAARGRIMTTRRWWLTPLVAQWRYMVECGQYEGHLWEFPRLRGVREKRDETNVE